MSAPSEAKEAMSAEGARQAGRMEHRYVSLRMRELEEEGEEQIVYCNMSAAKHL